VILLIKQFAFTVFSLQIGNTALMYAAHGDHAHCTNELLLHGADITMINLNGDSAFGIAIKKGSKLGTVLIS
jgi:ankyrin repeat protein